MIPRVSGCPQAEEHLEQYYKFIACFDITPYATDKTNNQILYNADDDKYHIKVDPSNFDEYSLQDFWMSKYKKIKDTITMQEHNKVTRTWLRPTVPVMDRRCTGTGVPVHGRNRGVVGATGHGAGGQLRI